LNNVAPGSGNFDLHGVRLCVECSLASAERPIANLLKRFASASRETNDIKLIVAETDDPDSLGDRLPAAAGIVYSRKRDDRDTRLDPGVEFDVYRTPTGVIVDLGGHGMMTLEPQSGRGTILLACVEKLHPDIIGSLLLFSLSELLKTRGLHLVHAAAVALDRRAVVIPGTQGRGKTTACLSLVAGGFSFLSDDVVFLRAHGGTVEVCALPEHVSVTDRTIGMFPELRERAATLEVGLLKRHGEIDELFDRPVELNACPVILLFPEVTGRPESRLTPLPRARALEMLLPRGLSVLDRAHAAQHFQLMSRLVAQCACFRLEFGTRIEAMPAMIKETMASLQ
jgi:hypothetical protein